MKRLVVTLFCLLPATILAQRDYTTPVPILKQINRHHDDGSYSYGYEGADGSFKIETKYPTGEVYGKYGYVDDSGKLREVEYGASRRGFEPQGNDINVPPPTLTNNHPYPLGPNEQDDGQYREDPSTYYKNEKFNRPVPATNFRLNNVEPARPRYNPPPPPQPRAPAPQPNYYNPPPPQQQYQQPQYQQPQYQQPQYQQSNRPQNYNNVNVPNYHHPAVKNIDIWSGSYSIDYKR